MGGSGPAVSAHGASTVVQRDIRRRRVGRVVPAGDEADPGYRAFRRYGLVPTRVRDGDGWATLGEVGVPAPADALAVRELPPHLPAVDRCTGEVRDGGVHLELSGPGAG